MRNVFLMLMASLSLLAFSACTSAVRYSPEEIKDYPPAVQEQIRQGNVVLGMTAQQVRYAWGSPSSVNVLPPTEEGKAKEEWLYSRMGVFMERRLLFVDGKLVDIFPQPKQAPRAEPRPEEPAEKK